MIVLVTGFPTVAGALRLGSRRTDATAPRGCGYSGDHGPDPVDWPGTVLALGHLLPGGHVLALVQPAEQDELRAQFRV
jgi:hypothetical protein